MFVLREDQLRALGAAAAERGRRRLHGDLESAGLKVATGDDPETMALTDAQGRTATVRFGGEHASVTSPLGRTCGFRFDAANRLAGVVDPAGGSVSYERDAAGRLTAIERADGSRFAFDYDEDGEVAALHYPDLAVHRFLHDESGRIIRSIDRVGRHRLYDYDPLGPPSRIDFDADRQVLYAYDDDGELAAVDEPGRPQVTFEVDPEDASVVSKRDGRETLRVRASETDDRIEHNYPDGGWSRFLTDDNGRLIEAETPGSSLRLAYDDGGRLTSETCDGAQVIYERDASGALTGIVTPDGTRIAYERDADGLLRLVRDRHGQEYRLDYSAAMILEAIAYPNGVTLSRRSNRLGLLEGLEVATADQSLVDLNWRYDAGDRVAEESRGGGAPRRRFGYDLDGRLLRVESDDPSLAEAFELDERGNRLSANGVSAEFDAADQIRRRGGAAIAYDDNGCVSQFDLAGGPVTLVHDHQSRLSEARTRQNVSRYRYDPIGRRIAKEVSDLDGRRISSTRYLWAGSLMLSETTERPDKAPEVCEYLPVPDLGVHLAQRVDGRDYCLHYGRRLEAIAMTDRHGGLVWRADYSAFGELRAEIAAVAQPFRLLGQYADAETGLFYNLARYYDPRLGRFLERDPLGFQGGSWNDYIYGDGDPLNRVDPTGEFLPLVIAAGIGAGVGAGIGAAIGGGLEIYRQRKENPGGELDWGKIGQEAKVGGVIGAVGGAVGVLAFPLAAAMGMGLLGVMGAGAIVGGSSGAIEACIEANMRGVPLTLGGLGDAALMGAGIGAVTGGVGGVIANRARRVTSAAAAARSQRPRLATETAPFTRMSQPGGLMATEGSQVVRANGSLSAPTHPLFKHGPDVTDAYLQGRVQTELAARGQAGLRTAFNDRAQMEGAIAETFSMRQGDISAWLATNPRAGVPRAFEANPGMGNLGRGFEITTRGGPIAPITKSMPNVNLVLMPNGRGGYLIHTAHPF